MVNIRLVLDFETGKPKGFAFVEYEDAATALSAIRNLNGFECNGRPVCVLLILLYEKYIFLGTYVELIDTVHGRIYESRTAFTTEYQPLNRSNS